MSPKKVGMTNIKEAPDKKIEEKANELLNEGYNG